MNKYITELSTIIPMCGAMARKLDKLTPELNALVLLAARNCFLLVVGCDRGRLLYVSASSRNADQAPASVKQEDPAKMRKKNNGKKYCVVQCTGYLKLWASAEANELSEGGEEGDGSMSCLVALGRALPDLAPAPPPGPQSPRTRRLQFELLGTSLYEYVSAPELGAVARTHKAALLDRLALHTPPYAFRRKDGTRARLQTHFKPFKNPWTKEVECLVANNTILSDSDDSLAPDDKNEAFDSYKHKPDLEMQRLIDSQVESHNIGSAIADEALRRSSPDFSPDLPVDLLQEAVFGQSASLMDNILGVDMGFGQVRNNVSLSTAGGASPVGGLEPMAGESPPPGTPPLPALGLDGNSEAAMAVIMSLLEADVGLGGPINITGLPWPLP
ncbi:hypothetical protein MSG28_000737 [Choristoneura fumiferana]|uniref:Uncharacterized protein n=1 Tax=Choristoneura fumiferana TaxID=7141 RepID=A0ACC0K202_CHOFU|nr:hypothetical protein MSG28_000737 [Choristoneura fumiferana]